MVCNGGVDRGRWAGCRKLCRSALRSTNGKIAVQRLVTASLEIRVVPATRIDALEAADTTGRILRAWDGIRVLSLDCVLARLSGEASIALDLSERR